MPGFLIPAGGSGEEAAAASGALVGLSVVEGVEEFGPEGFEGGGGHGDDGGFAGAGVDGYGGLEGGGHGLGGGSRVAGEGFEEGGSGVRGLWRCCCWRSRLR